jgi:hypothetical protein
MAKLEFAQVDINSLSEDQYRALEVYLEAKMTLRRALEASAPEGYSVRFSERYGTPDNIAACVLKVALAPKAKPKEDRNTARPLSAFFKERAAAGLRI